MRGPAVRLRGRGRVLVEVSRLGRSEGSAAAVAARREGGRWHGRCRLAVKMKAPCAVCCVSGPASLACVMVMAVKTVISETFNVLQ